MTDPSLLELLNTTRDQYLDGRVGEVIEGLMRLEKLALHDPAFLQQIAEMYVQCGQHQDAERCYARSVELQPSNPDYLYNLGASRTALGELEDAEKLFTHAIRFNPKDYGAWLNRSGLKKQTPQSNHVDQLKFVRSRLNKNEPGMIQVCYALAKELEDLRNYDEAFQFLQEGAHLRRLGMQYDVQEDEQVMTKIAQRFNASPHGTISNGQECDRPVFILGLPRSGTTLTDRIVSAHSHVGSLGEHNTLPLALLKMTTVEGDPPPGKEELVDRSAAIDFSELGRKYCESIDGFGNPSPRLIDKTPLNFLYIGLIHLALPNAKIIHLRRHPVDVCYAMYKTLFRAGYPFSYSLQEVGRYFIAYHGLMNHWRSSIPNAFLDVDYENIIADQEGQTRRILDYLELDWEDKCLDFHQHRGPAATASAAQVRQPIYSSSVGLWRKYQQQLGPFAARLKEHGISIE